MEGFFGVVLGYGISIWVIVKIVKFITRLFSDSDSIGNMPSQEIVEEVRPENNKHQYIMENADAFVSLCRKIGVGGKGNVIFPVTFKFETQETGLVIVYATHTIHDDNWMDIAFKRAREGDRAGTEYAYKNMINQYGLTDKELRSFQDLSDFMEFLRGGISGYNSCSRSGNDIEIIQQLGAIQSNDKNTILMQIERYIKNAYSGIESKRYGTTALSIYFR